jgi:eukaryotic-like serine/threonine-protein kinase
MAEISQRLSLALADRYRIERELGAGGMATVYLAEDLKHDRKVALKVLRPELAAVIGAERFLAEIKTTAHLQHPHILPLFDSGEADGFLFYVMPSIEGETVRDRLDREKQLPIAEAVRIASEIAAALDYAHRHGVIHRDIKPENVLLHDGSALVADFGIALAASKAGGTRMTETGMSLGTPHYMSPEQALGEREITARSDVYALGCVLYEMLLGEPPFTGPTAQSIVAKVMSEKPARLVPRRDRIPPAVEDAVLTALEKLPADRFATAAEFADALRGAVGRGARRADATVPTRVGLGWRHWIAVAVVAMMTGVGGYVLGRRADAGTSVGQLSFQQRTFRSETVFTARYTSTGESIVFSAAEEGTTPRLFLVGSGYPEPRPVGDPGVHLLSVSSRDELAVLVRASYIGHRIFVGTLGRMPVGGLAPREILDGVRDADWSPDGSQLAIVHEVDGKDRLEYPIGTVLYESAGYLADVRVSPNGERIAFHEHPYRWDDRGVVAVVDLKGGHRILTGDYPGLEGLAWTRDGGRIVFAGAEDGPYQIKEVTLDGRVRLALPSGSDATMHDIAPDGRWLMTREDLLHRLMARAPEDSSERDLSWLDLSTDAVISADGRLIAFSDVSSEGGPTYATMIRRTDGSPAVRIGVGGARAISPDGRWILSVVPTRPQQLALHPAGAGESRRVDGGELESYSDARFLPDGERLLVCGNEPGRAVRCYVRPLAPGALRPITPPGVNQVIISPDGQHVVGTSADSGYRIYAVDDGSARAVPGLAADEEVLRYSPDGRALWIRRPRALPVQVERFDFMTGRRTPLVTLLADAPPGLLWASRVSLADDPRAYAYVARVRLSRLFDLRGMR